MGSNKKTTIIRSSPEFKKMLRDVNIERIKKGKSNKLLSSRRLTLAMTRVPNLKKFMVESEFKDE